MPYLILFVGDIGPQAEMAMHGILEKNLSEKAPFVYNRDLLNEVLEVLYKYLRGNTTKNYRSGLSSYVKFFQDNGIPPKVAFPASDMMLAASSARTCKRLTYASDKTYWQ